MVLPFLCVPSQTKKQSWVIGVLNAVLLLGDPRISEENLRGKKSVRGSTNLRARESTNLRGKKKKRVAMGMPCLSWLACLAKKKK